MKIIRLMCLALLLLLTSCSLLAQTPPDQAVELAITQQLNHTQGALARDLGIVSQQALSNGPTSNFKIDSITVQSREKIADPSQLNRRNLNPIINEVYRVRGKFDATLTADKLQKKQKNSPFEIVLGKETTDDDTNPVETWYFIE